MNKKFIVTGIGTDIGKTVVSSILAQALKASYWKPIQAGELNNSDSIKVKNWCDENVTIIPESFQLTKPVSPHLAAELDGIKITKDTIIFPNVSGDLIIEGAGGLMVPLNNDGLLYIDLIQSWNIPVLLVSRHYLGSINHTLLSAEVLKTRNIKVAGIIFVGEENKATENIILQQTKLKLITRIPFSNEIDKNFIQEQAKILSTILTRSIPEIL